MSLASRNNGSWPISVDLADERYLGNTVLDRSLPIGLPGNPQRLVPVLVFEAEDLFQEARHAVAAFGGVVPRNVEQRRNLHGESRQFGSHLENPG
jgi:hypothetical protein